MLHRLHSLHRGFGSDKRRLRGCPRPQPSHKALAPAKRRHRAAQAETIQATSTDYNGATVESGSAAAASPEGEQQTIELRVEVIRSMNDVSEAEWDAVACGGQEVNPFLKWRFLQILEDSQSAVAQEGWGPQHLLVRDAQGTLLGCCPLYLKGHSYGEYVFDNSWANFSHMLGQRYYPKLQSCIPFTPVTGPRLLVAPGANGPLIQIVLAKALVSLADAVDVSSVHLTFATGDEWSQLGSQGWQLRRGIQYHWENEGYNTFEDFLGQLKQSKRKSIRQERKAMAAQGLHIQRLTGAGITPQHWDTFYEFYLNTVEKRWGSAYLTREFFTLLGQHMSEEVLLVVAEEADSGRMVAAALNMIGSHCLYGRNWGCVADKEYKHLHFELCYYQAIEEAIARGLPRVEAGAQGEHKLQRGYLPNLTYSAHWVRDPTLRHAVGKFLTREDSQIQYTWQALTVQGSPYKKERTLMYLVDKVNTYSSLSSADDEEAAAAALLSGDELQQ